MPSGKHLTKGEITRIRQLFDEGLTTKQITTRLGIQRSCVNIERIKYKNERDRLNELSRLPFNL
jgi:IS30 family transposase